MNKYFNKYLIYYFIILILGSYLNIYFLKKYSDNCYFLGILIGCLLSNAWINYINNIRK